MNESEREQFEKKMAKWGEELTEQVIRAMWLRTIDLFWVEHLNAMESLRTGIGLRGYGQHNPLVAYRQEAYHLFERLKGGIEQEVVRLLLTIEVNRQTPPTTAQPALPHDLEYQGAKKTGDPASAVSAKMESETEKRDTPVQATSDRVGRNDPCPCGSGKKYKKCHGK